MRSLPYVWSRLLKKLRGSAIQNSRIDRSAKVEAGSTLVNSSLGRHSFNGYDCTIVNCDIGSFCSIANRVSIGGLAHPMHFVSTSPVFLSHQDSVKKKYACHEYLPMVRTVIGNDVWIGEGAFIKAGVHIGHGAVIGMGSVVTRDVEPYTIVAGNPAKVLRRRFEPAVIEGLLALAWWNWSDEELTRLAPLFDEPLELLNSRPTK